MEQKAEQKIIKTVQKKGKNKEEAIEAALLELGITENEAEIEIIEEAQKGFLGLLGSKPALVEVRVKEDPIANAQDLLTEILKSMKFNDFNFSIKNDSEYTKIMIDGNDLGILIGRRGETLDALQYIINLSVNKGRHDKLRIVLDVGDYRNRREKTLQELAYKLARKVKTKRQKVVLEPMNPQERRIIHSALQDYPGITTHSEGEEPYRKVVISLKD